MKLSVQDLTAEAFAPFGKVIDRPGRAHDASGPGWDWWAETALLPADTRSWSIGYLDLKPADLVFDRAERHMRAVELLIPLGGDCLVYAGPPEAMDEPMHMPPLDQFRVFCIRQGQAALLGKGVWHGAPMALADPLKVIVLLPQNTGKDDAYVVHFGTLVAIEHSDP